MKFVTKFSAVNLLSDPQLALDGELYFNTASNVFRYYNSGSWLSIIDTHILKEQITDTIFNVGSDQTASFSYTISNLNVNGSIIGSSASISKFIIPSDDDNFIPTGSIIRIVHAGLGSVEIVPHIDVSLHYPSSIYLKSRWQSVNIIKTDDNTWILTGEFPDLY